jgi:aminoglycoside 6'-N-acetyltransferase
MSGPPPLDERIRLRPVTLADVPMLEHWDHQPHVIAATSDDPADGTALDGAYWPDEIARSAPDYQYLMAELQGRPIGALLIIDPHTEPTHYWGDIEPDLRAIDIWIGESGDLGKGYGETMMRQALKLCFSASNVNAVVIDPLASNVRAHKFYQRLGFVAERHRTFGDAACLVHRLTRADWRLRFPDD